MIDRNTDWKEVTAGHTPVRPETGCKGKKRYHTDGLMCHMHNVTYENIFSTQGYMKHRLLQIDKLPITADVDQYLANFLCVCLHKLVNTPQAPKHKDDRETVKL